MPSFQPIRKYNKFHIQTAEIINDKNKKMEPKLIIQVLEIFNDYSFKNLFQFGFYFSKIQYKYLKTRVIFSFTILRNVVDKHDVKQDINPISIHS